MNESRESAPSPPDRAAIALWVALAVLAAMRAILAFVPTMWGWGFNLLRFVAPVPGWILWALVALTLIPALGRAVLRGFEGAAQVLERWPALAYMLWGVGGAALAWFLPDRVHFVGDFLVRIRTGDRDADPATLFPQALPLDVLLHLRLPRLLADWLFLDPNLAARALGALEAATLAILAWGFARVLALRGAIALAVAAAVFFGGHLGVFTGYSKSVAELALLTVAVGVLGLSVLRGGSLAALVAMVACAAAGFALHRAALAWLPALVLVVWHLARSPELRPLWQRPLARGSLLLPVALLAAMLPRILDTLIHIDPVHLAPSGADRGGWLPSTFGGTRPLDLLNVVALLSPLAPGVALAALLSRWRPSDRTREAWFLTLLAVPWVGLLVVVHPVQGPFRDWDDFTAMGAALSLLAAWWAAAALSRAPIWAWLAAPLALGAVAPATQWLLHNADLDRGMIRVEAYLREPPARPKGERARALDFLGLRSIQLERWDRAADAMSQAAALAPSPRVLLLWAWAEHARGNGRVAQDVYRRLLAVTPDDPRAWDGLASVSWKLRDWAECRRAALELQRLMPGDPVSQRILERLDRGDTTNVER